MSDLVIKGYTINTPIKQILEKARYQLTNGKLRHIEDKGDDILCTCPNHKDGHENHPSCFVYTGNSPNIEYGTAHCFTCGSSWSLHRFIGMCFDSDDEFGKNWLINNFGILTEDVSVNLDKIELNKKKKDTIVLDETILDTFEDWHPYMAERKLTPAVVKYFKIKYDKQTDSLVFPVWDEQNRLRFLTRRYIKNKYFMIDKDADKIIYLLNEIIKHNYKTVAVCESQLDALYLWTVGIPAIALLGAGTTKEQMKIINNTDVKMWLLCYDPDSAGDKGRKRFKSMIRKDVFVEDIHMPANKDVNDLTIDEIITLFSKYFVK